ncbi:beclin-1-like [Dendronephthya gigantea]|uniref:beclin-1-like n=1 Tax=Dendronephthya gigantea TaxID=151771 RepID=UPI00106D0566|nr:beclin-1-like [Dendronephthya gigantea]
MSGSRGTTRVSFVCQRCSQPLRLDQSSFSSIDDETLSELTLPLPSLPVVPTDKSTGKETDSKNEVHISEVNDNVVRRTITSKRSIDGNGFTLIDAQNVRSDNLSHRLKVTSQLFDIMSAQSNIDHPLCEECTDTLLDLLDHQLKVTTDELNDYSKEFLDKVDSNKEEDTESLTKDLENLKLEESQLIQELENIEIERSKVKQSIAKQKEEAERLDKEEERYWIQYNEHHKQLLDFQEEQQSVDNQLHNAQMQLDKLKKTNVFNSTFNIWYKGHFGTINNFRLGRLPSVPVEWTEINAAWGQTVLLLHALARKMNLKFKKYRLVPFGNHSYLESLDDKSKELPLYASGGFRFFWDTKFDHGMVAFLDCLQQFKEEVEKVDKRFCLPYRMDDGKIFDSSGTGGSYSIKIQFNSEEHWTKALKFMLTNLKWGLAWLNAQFSEK